MIKKSILLLAAGLWFCTGISFAQNDSTATTGLQAFFGSAKFQVDTTTPPVDSLTAKIQLLRAGELVR